MLRSASSGYSSGWNMKGGGIGKRLLGISIGTTWIRLRSFFVKRSFVHSTEPYTVIIIQVSMCIVQSPMVVGIVAVLDCRIMTYLDFGVERVVFADGDMHTWVPLQTSLLQQNVVPEDLSCVAPLLNTEPSTSRVRLIVGRTSHNFGGESHSLPGQNGLGLLA